MATDVADTLDSEAVRSELLAMYHARAGQGFLQSLLDAASNPIRPKRGIDVVICHPKLVETGLDLLEFPTILFHEAGYSLHTLRQASRRSWRIGQKHPVEVKFFAYSGTMQEVCLRLMGKKLLVALAMEGKFTSDGLQAIDGDDDMLTAMARELVQNKGIGESADNLWRRVGAFLPTSGQQEPMEGHRAVSEGNGANIPKFPPPSGADHATTPVCAFAGSHTDRSTDFAVQLPLF